MGKRGKLIKQLKKQGLWVEKPEDVVTDIVYNVSGDPNEVFVSPWNEEIIIPEFMAEPWPSTDEENPIVIVSRRRALDQKEKMLQNFPDWFTDHKLLPSVLEAREQILPARDKVILLRKQFGIVPDKNLVCCICHRFHGAIFPVSGMPHVRYRFTDVSFVKFGRYETIQEANAYGVCGNCESETKDEKFYPLALTKKIIIERNEFVRQCRAAVNRPQPRPSAPAKIVPIVKQDDRPTEVIIAERLARERQKKAAAR